MENKNEIVEETTEKKKKEPMTTKQKVMLGLRIAFNVVFYALIIFLFLFSLMNIRGGNGTENFPNIFGKGFLNVQSNSMQRDENKTIYPEWNEYSIKGFSEGDLVNVDVVDQNAINNLKVGDVITFRWKIGSTKILNTHRIVYIHKDANGNVDYVDTQGDKVAQETKYSENWSDAQKMTNIAYYNSNDLGLERTVAEHVDASMILGKVTSVNAGVGAFLDKVQKNWLFIFVIPIIVLLVIEIFLVIRNIMILRGEKNKLELADSKEAMLAEVEAEKEKMRQELLAELRAQGLAPAEDKKPEPQPEPEPVAEEPAKEEVSAEEEKTVLVADEVTSTEENKEPETVEAVEEVKEEVEPEVVEEAPVVEETPTEEPKVVEEKVEEPVVEEAPVEEEPQVEAEPETQPEEVASEQPAEEVKDETLKIKVDETEEANDAPKKTTTRKSTSSTAKKSTSTAKKTSTTKKASTTAKKASTTKKTTKKTEE